MLLTPFVDLVTADITGNSIRVGAELKQLIETPRSIDLKVLFSRTDNGHTNQSLFGVNANIVF